MMERREDAFYYVTVMNENYPQPTLPVGVEGDIIQGLYRYGERVPVAGSKAHIRLLGSGAILREVIAAADLLAADWGVSSDIFSATSFSELAKDARDAVRWNRLHPEETERVPHVARLLAGSTPIVAATDYVAALPQMIAPFVDARLVALGTDGFGRSDTRAALRRFFEVDRHQIAVAALHELARRQAVPNRTVSEAIRRYGINADAPPPWQV